MTFCENIKSFNFLMFDNKKPYVHKLNYELLLPQSIKKLKYFCIRFSGIEWI